jgi:hypothetical protein
VLHIHTIVEECEVTKLLYAVDMKTKDQKKVSRHGSCVIQHVVLQPPAVCASGGMVGCVEGVEGMCDTQCKRG